MNMYCLEQFPVTFLQHYISIVFLTHSTAFLLAQKKNRNSTTKLSYKCPTYSSRLKQKENFRSNIETAKTSTSLNLEFSSIPNFKKSIAVTMPHINLQKSYL